MLWCFLTCKVKAIYYFTYSTVEIRMLLGINWYHFISNDEVRRQTIQPLLREIIQHGVRLTLFGHTARMDDSVDRIYHQILTSLPSVYWKRPPGWPGWRRCRTTSTPTGCHGPTQSTWPRTDHSEACWRPVALRSRGEEEVWLRLAGRRPMMCYVTLTSMTFDKKSNGVASESSRSNHHMTSY